MTTSDTQRIRPTEDQSATIVLDSYARRLLTVAEARDELRLGATKCAELLASGELASIRVGRRRLVPVKAIDDYIAAQLSAARGERPNSINIPARTGA
ncbi:MAG: helix-turn-helix domain-containing protein [Acidimicrobiales bacterium]